MIHKLKLKEPYIEPVLSGEKTFEVRENDRGFNKGDYIKFIPTHMNGETYKDTELEVTYIAAWESKRVIVYLESKNATSLWRKDRNDMGTIC